MIRAFEERCERLLANLLWYGTLAAAMIIGAGLAFGYLNVAKSGIALFILLPIGRVALMFVMFVWEKDYVYAMVSALVLLIIAASVIAGL